MLRPETESRIVIYGDPLAAARMFFTLDYFGAGDRAALLDGGLRGWKAEGLPLSIEPWQGPPGRLEWTLHPHVVADAAWVHDHLDEPTAAILDARPEADFVPHIPGLSLFRRPLLGVRAPAVRRLLRGLEPPARIAGGAMTGRSGFRAAWMTGTGPRPAAQPRARESMRHPRRR